MHEAAHALADVRHIKDTSRQGHWHNARFKALAEELGIAVTKDPRIGWSPTTVTDSTRADYADTLAELAGAMHLYRVAENGGDSGGKAKTPPACVCGCEEQAGYRAARRPQDAWFTISADFSTGGYYRAAQS